MEKNGKGHDTMTIGIIGGGASGMAAALAKSELDEEEYIGSPLVLSVKSLEN